MWRKIALVFALLLGTTMGLAQSVTPVWASSGLSATYEIVIEKPETHILHVNATFTNPPQILRLRILVPGTLTYQISMSPDEVITYPFHVTNIEVRDERGRSIPFTWNPRPGEPSYLTIKANGVSPVHLSYDASVLRPSGVRIGWEHVRAEAYLGPEYGLLLPDALLFLPLTLPTVTLRFHLPQGWRAVVDGKETNPNEYIVDITPAQHNDCICGALSFIGVGPLQVFRKHIAGKDLIIAIQKGKQIPAAEMIDLASRSFAYYSQRFGHYPNGDRFLALFFKDVSRDGCFHGFLFSPRAGNSNAHNYLGTPRPQNCYPTWYMLIPDEMIYLWMDGLKVYGNIHPDASWLIQSMGVVFMRLTVKLGYASEAEYYSRVLSDWRVYQDDLKSAGVTNADIVLAHADSPLIVGKSGLITYILQEDIATATHGEKDYTDLLSMAVLPHPQNFTNGEILQALKTLTGKDYTDFFRKYIYGTADLPMDWAEAKYKEALANGPAVAHPDPRPGLKGWQISWPDSQIMEDGQIEDWPDLSPMLTLGEVPVYAFADKNYLYLRLGHYTQIHQKIVLTLFSKTNRVGLFVDPQEPDYIVAQPLGRDATVIPIAEQQGEDLEIVIPKEYLGKVEDFRLLGALSSTAQWNNFADEMVQPTPTPIPTLTSTPALTPTPLTTPTFTPLPPTVTPSPFPRAAPQASMQFWWYLVLLLLGGAGWILGRWLKGR